MFYVCVTHEVTALKVSVDYHPVIARHVLWLPMWSWTSTSSLPFWSHTHTSLHSSSLLLLLLLLLQTYFFFSSSSDLSSSSLLHSNNHLVINTAINMTIKFSDSSIIFFVFTVMIVWCTDGYGGTPYQANSTKSLASICNGPLPPIGPAFFGLYR